MCKAGLQCSTPEHFPRDQELWVEGHSLGCSGQRWLRNSVGSLSTCLGKVRGGFSYVLLSKKTPNKSKLTEVRPPNPAEEVAVVNFPSSPAQHLLQKGLLTLVSQLPGY